MENFFDHDIRFEVKAQEKPKKRKRWLLSRQYLLPLNDDEEEDPRDGDNFGQKKKFRSGYEAAMYGMREGVLTGVFLGGCWGIFKHLEENFGLSYLGFGKAEDNNKGDNNPSKEVFSSRIPSHKRPVERDTQSRHERSPEPKESPSNQENMSAYTKTVSIVRNRSPKDPFETNRSVYKFTNSKLPVSTDKRITTMRTNAGTIEQNMYTYRRNKEKVQIVGYAFIHTTGSIVEESSSGSSNSTESDDGKNSPSKQDNKGGKEPAAPLVCESSHKRVESSAGILKSESKKSSLVVRTVPSSMKSPGGGGRSKDQLHKTESRHLSVVEPRSRKATHDWGSRKMDTSKRKGSSKVESYLGSPCESLDLRPSKASNYSIDSPARPKYIFERNSKRSIATTYQRSKKSVEYSKRGSIASDTIYPDPKKTGSILVNFSSVSNGFTSPPPIDFYEQTVGQSRAEDFPYSEPRKETSKSDAGRKRGETERYIRYEDSSDYNKSRMYLDKSSRPHRRLTRSTSRSRLSKADSRAAMGSSSRLGSDHPVTPQESRYDVQSNTGLRSEAPMDSNSRILRSEYPEAPMDSSSRMLRSEYPEAPMDSSSRMLRSEYPEAPMDSSSRILRSDYTVTPQESRYNVQSNTGLKLEAPMDSRLRSDLPEAPTDGGYNLQSSAMLRSSATDAPNKSSYSLYSSTTQNRSDYSEPRGERRPSVESGILAKTSYSRETPEEVEYQSYTAEEPMRSSVGSGYFSIVSSSTAQQDSASVQGARRQDSGTRSYTGARSSRTGAVGSADAVGTTGKTVGQEDEAVQKKKGSRSLSFLPGKNDNLIVLSACNCAIVLGVLCSIICTTRASFT